MLIKYKKAPYCQLDNAEVSPVVPAYLVVNSQRLNRCGHQRTVQAMKRRHKGSTHQWLRAKAVEDIAGLRGGTLQTASCLLWDLIVIARQALCRA